MALKYVSTIWLFLVFGSNKSFSSIVKAQVRFDTIITFIDSTIFDVAMEEDWSTGELLLAPYPRKPLKNGLWKFQDKDGLIYREIEIENGSIISKVIRYKDQSYTTEVHYTKRNERLDSPILMISYYPDGQKRWEYSDYRYQSLNVYCQNDSLIVDSLSLKIPMDCDCTCEGEKVRSSYMTTILKSWDEQGNLTKHRSREEDLFDDVQSRYRYRHKIIR